jgi:hypothetical protein
MRELHQDAVTTAQSGPATTIVPTVWLPARGYSGKAPVLTRQRWRSAALGD